MQHNVAMRKSFRSSSIIRPIWICRTRYDHRGIGRSIDLCSFLLSQRGLSALHSACKRQQIPIALTLIHAGCNLNLIDIVRNADGIRSRGVARRLSRAMKLHCTMPAAKDCCRWLKLSARTVAEWICETRQMPRRYI